jgi:hypothetical protein
VGGGTGEGALGAEERLMQMEAGEGRRLQGYTCLGAVGGALRDCLQRQNGRVWW